MLRLRPTVSLRNTSSVGKEGFTGTRSHQKVELDESSSKPLDHDRADLKSWGSVLVYLI
jgi:hypothetical protein